MPVSAKLSGVLASQDRRADTPLSVRVKHRLQHCGYQSVRHISVHEHEGVLTLHGNLPSFYLKQIAQATVAKVPGVEQIHNRVQVVYRAS